MVLRRSRHFLCRQQHRPARRRGRRHVGRTSVRGRPAPWPVRVGRRTLPCRPGPRWPRPAAARRRLRARRTPPTPTIGSSGRAACTSCTARTATAWMAGPDRPAAPAAEHGPAGFDVDGHAEQRVDQRDRLGPGLVGGRGDLGQVGDVRAELGPAGPAAARGGGRPPRPSPRASGRTSAAGPPGSGSSRSPPPRRRLRARRPALAQRRRTRRPCGPRCWPRPEPWRPAAPATRPAATPRHRGPAAPPS